MRLIDADNLKKDFNLNFGGVSHAAAAAEIIDRQPAIAAPTREQVEALPKCDYCEAEWGTCDPITNRFTMPPRGGIRFCPMCGRPITDEAVDIMLKRLEVMKDENRTD